MRWFVIAVLIGFSGGLLPDAAAQTCGTAPEPILQPGQVARVTAGPANNVREEPSTGAALVGELAGLQTFAIFEGPVCSDGLYWYRVSGRGDPSVIGFEEAAAISGWTASGSDGVYWIEPLPALADEAEGFTLVNSYGQPAFRRAVFSPNSLLFAAYRGDGIHIYDRNGSALHVISLNSLPEDANDIAWTADGQLIAGSALIDPVTGDVTLDSPRQRVQPASIPRFDVMDDLLLEAGFDLPPAFGVIAISPDGTRVLVDLEVQPELDPRAPYTQLLDLANGTIVHEWPQTYSTIVFVSVMSDGRVWFFSGGELVFDARSGERLEVSGPAAVSFSGYQTAAFDDYVVANAFYVLSDVAFSDEGALDIVLLNRATGNAITIAEAFDVDNIEDADGIDWPRFAFNGQLIALGTGDTITLYTTDITEATPAVTPTGVEVMLEDGVVENLTLSPDGTVLAVFTRAGSINLYDTRTGDLLTALHDHDALVPVQSWDWSADGRQLLVGLSSGEARLFALPGALPE